MWHICGGQRIPWWVRALPSHVDPRDWTQVVGVGSRCPYPLSRLISSNNVLSCKELQIYWRLQWEQIVFFLFPPLIASASCLCWDKFSCTDWVRSAVIWFHLPVFPPNIPLKTPTVLLLIWRERDTCTDDEKEKWHLLWKSSQWLDDSISKCKEMKEKWKDLHKNASAEIFHLVFHISPKIETTRFPFKETWTKNSGLIGETQLRGKKGLCCASRTLIRAGHVAQLEDRVFV